MANYNTIVLRASEVRRTIEAQAGVAINPGYFCKLYAATTLKVKPWDVAGVVKSSKYFAVEQEYLGKGITTQYAIGDSVMMHPAQSGDEVYARLAASATAVTLGDMLEPANDGTLKKVTADSVPAITDSTGGTGATTFAAITAGGTYAQADIVAIKNALSEIATILNILNTMGDFAPIAQAIETVDNSGGASEAFIRCLVL